MSATRSLPTDRTEAVEVILAGLQKLIAAHPETGSLYVSENRKDTARASAETAIAMLLLDTNDHLRDIASSLRALSNRDIRKGQM